MSGTTTSTPSSSAPGNSTPGVDDEDVVAASQGEHVHAELAQASERNYLQVVIRQKFRPPKTV